MFVFRLIGTFIKRRSFVSWYSTVMAWHLGFSIASGAFFIFTLFRKAGENEVDKCIANNGGDSNKEEDCRRAFKLGRGIVIALYIVFWLFELCTSSSHLSTFSWFATGFIDLRMNRGLCHHQRLRLTAGRGRGAGQSATRADICERTDGYDV
jgi:hypothetical protein